MMKLFVLSYSSYNRINLILDEHDGYLSLLEKHLSSINGLKINRDGHHIEIIHNARRFSQDSIAEYLTNLFLRNGFMVQSGKVVNSNFGEIAQKYNFEQVVKKPWQIDINEELLSIEFYHPSPLDAIKALDPADLIFHERAVSLELTAVNHLVIGFYGDKIGGHLQWIHSNLESRIDYAEHPLDKCIKEQCIAFYSDSIANDFCPLVKQIQALLEQVGYVRDSAYIQNTPSNHLVESLESLDFGFTEAELFNYAQVEIMYTPE